MKQDSRLSDALHILLHLAQQETPVTSDVLGRSLGSHAVVIRRILAGLRAAGHVQSGKGHGGGWTLARDPGRITLMDVHRALGSPALLAVGHRSAHPGCRVEAAVNNALNGAFQQAEALLLGRLDKVTLDHLLSRLPRARGKHTLAAHGHSRG